MREGITDVLINLNFTGYVNNNQLIEAYEWISNFIHNREIKKKVNIIYGSITEQKDRRVQFFSKKEKDLRLKLPKLKFQYISIYKLDAIEHAFHALDNSFNFSLDQPFKIIYSKSPNYVSCGHVSFSLNYEFWKEIIDDTYIEKALAELINIINKSKTKVVYGMVVKMPRVKSASFYTRGIGNFSLNDEEERSVNIYNEDKVKEKLWEPFWGNIITKNHFKSKAHYKALVNLIGEENVKNITKDVFFFKMPVSINDFEYGSKLHNKYKKTIYKLFLVHNRALTK